MEIKFSVKKILLTFIFLCNSFSQNLEIKIYLEKNVFIQGEDVNLPIELINHEDRDILIEMPSIKTGSLDINLTDSKIENYYYKGGTVEGSSKSLFEPGARCVGCINLDKGYASLKNMSGVTVLSKGTYSVKVIFYPDNDNRSNKIESNSINFTVNVPEGKEMLAFEEYKKGYSSYWAYRDTEFVRIFDNIYKTYPNSVYTPHVLQLLQGVYHVRLLDTVKSKHYAQLLLQYPNSTRVEEGVRFLMRNFKEEDKIIFLDSLKIIYRNTYLEKYIDDYLKYSLIRKN